jgi:NADPH:quinone reductase
MVVENERIVITSHGPPSVLSVVHEPAPKPESGEIRIQIEAAGVSFGDVLQRSGLFFAGAPRMPYTPGYDVVGVVDAVGDGVTGVNVNQRVAAFTLFGGYARYVCVPSEYAVKVPEQLDAGETVALVLNYTTAFQMLRRIASVSHGQSILVYGGSGGVGSALLDLAHVFGLTVAAAVSKRWQELFKNQTTFLFDERDRGSEKALRDHRPLGFDAAFDAIGGLHAWKTRSFVRPQGKLVLFGVARAVKGDGRRDLSQLAPLVLLLAMSKLIRRPAVELYAIDQRVKTKRAEVNEDIEMLIELLQRKVIRPRIGARFALAEARQAHELLQSRNNVGKIVLMP